MTTANKITFGRIFLIPFFVMTAVYYGRGVSKGDPQEWQRYVTIAIFIVAAISDGVDGWLARHRGQRTQLGAILDPIADKGLMLAAIITLSVSNWNYELPLWFPVVVIARDVLVIAGALVLHILTGEIRVRPSWPGKTATALTMVALSLVMLQWNAELFEARIGNWHRSLEFLDVPVYLAGLFTVISAVGYVLDGIRQLHASGHGEPKPPNPS
ncbi:MAG: CDP-alcohol phosphatidyltransferase family protein [Chthoniobacteraceae bacterium]